MRPNVETCATSALLLFLFSTSATAQDWPQWRGPERDGISRETAWKPEGNAVWKKEVGLGYSTVSVVGSRVYTMGWADGEDTVWCLDANSGDVLWKHNYPAKKWDKFHGGGTNSTPSVEGEHVYVLNREARFVGLDASSGEERWTHDLMEIYELEIPTWGFAASPLILDEAVVLNIGHVLACDKETGEEKWMTGRNYGHGYSTPVDATLKGKACLVLFGGKGLAVLERATGRELAFVEWETKYDVNAASPVVIDDERIFISSGYGHGAAMVRFTGDALEILWETKGMRNQMATSVRIGDHLYGLDEGILKCFDFEGKELWRERGIGKGAISAADGRLLLMSEEGELVVVKADPAGFEELARQDIVEGGVCWTMPVLANGRIYGRNSLGHLVCSDHRGGGQ